VQTIVTAILQRLTRATEANKNLLQSSEAAQDLWKAVAGAYFF